MELATCENKLLIRQVDSLQKDCFVDRQTMTKLVETVATTTRVVEAKIAKLLQVWTIKISDHQSRLDKLTLFFN